MSSAVDHVDETSALLPEPGDSEDGVYPLTVKQSRKCCSGEMNGCCSTMASEFKMRKLGLKYDGKEEFYSSQWRWPPIVFICYRVVAAAYIIFWLFWGLVKDKSAYEHYPWPAWLTNWSFLVLSMHLLLSAVIALVHTGGNDCCRRTIVRHTRRFDSPILSNDSGDIPWYMKLDWVLYNVAAVFAFTVSGIYWLALFPQKHRDQPPSISDIHVHAINSVVILLEVLLNAIPIRYLHGVYSLVFGGLYAAFSLIYWAADHGNVLYPNVLDWNKPLGTMIYVAGLGIVGIPILQFILFFSYRLKVHVYWKLYAP